MKKKITRLSVFSVILLIALLIALPHLMEDKVGSLLKENVNGQIVGSFDFSKINLSLYKDFPNASVRLEHPSIINEESFHGDTLFAADKVELKIGITEFFEGADDPIEIKEFNVQGAMLNLRLNDAGLANYNIVRPSEIGEEGNSAEQTTIFALESYKIMDSKISYADAGSGTRLELKDFNHSGSGKFSADSSELLTETHSLISLYIDDKEYLEENKLKITALLGIDLESNTYSFKENVTILNKLPVKFEGYIRPLDEATEMDLSFSTISSDFKNFLAMIPERYTTDITLLETEGNFDLTGNVNGLLGEESIPEFTVQMKSKDASFKFPDLKKRVEHIHIDALVANSTGDAKDTEITIEHARFQIDRDTFQLKANITEIMGNTNVNSHVKGRLDLENLSEAYPIPSSIDMLGLVSADINSSFNLDDIDQKKYKNIQLDGSLDIKGLFYDFAALPQPLRIHTLEADLNSKNIELREMAGVSGNTDFALNGRLTNILGYLFSDEELQGDLDMRSNSFVVADLMDEAAEEEEGAEIAEQPFKVPANLNFNLSAIIGKAIYDDIVMYDLNAKARIKDEVITFSDLSARMLDGRLAAVGEVSTSGEEPEFDMALDFSKVDITKAFGTIDLVSVIAPALQAMDGRLNTKVSLSGKLTDQLDLDLNSLSGNILAEVLSAGINPKKTPALNQLNSKLKFADLSDADLSGLKTALSFEDGKVKLKPFTVKYQDIEVELSGGHSFAMALDYQMDFKVPSEYLGDDVNKLLAGIGDESLKDLKVPIRANLGGTYDKPTISSDLKEQTRLVTAELVDIQKEKYLNKGKEEVGQLISNVLSKDEGQNTDGKQTSNGTPDDQTKDVDDLVKAKAEAEAKAKNILGGLLNSKSRAVTAKDTLN